MQVFPNDGPTNHPLSGGVIVFFTFEKWQDLLGHFVYPGAVQGESCWNVALTQWHPDSPPLGESHPRCLFRKFSKISLPCCQDTCTFHTNNSLFTPTGRMSSPEITHGFWAAGGKHSRYDGQQRKLPITTLTIFHLFRRRLQVPCLFPERVGLWDRLLWSVSVDILPRGKVCDCTSTKWEGHWPQHMGQERDWSFTSQGHVCGGQLRWILTLPLELGRGPPTLVSWLGCEFQFETNLLTHLHVCKSYYPVSTPMLLMLVILSL